MNLSMRVLIAVVATAGVLALVGTYLGAAALQDESPNELGAEPTPGDDLTQPPPGEPPPLCPSPDAADAARPTGQTFQLPGGTTIPIPTGASTDSYTLNSTTFYRVSLGLSLLAFDAQGVMSAIGVHAEHCEVFEPTFAALAALRAQIPPPPLVVEGVSIPIPPGGHYSGPPVGAGVPPSYGIYRGDSFVRFSTAGVIQSDISQADSADFEPVLEAIERLAARESQ